MTNTRRNRTQKKQGGARYAALAILAVILLAVGAYFIFKSASTPSPLPLSKTDLRQSPDSTPQKKQLPAAVTPMPQQLQSSAKKYPPVNPLKPENSQIEVSPGVGAGQLAIIIDDMGSSLQEARSLAGIGVPLTFSIIPGLRNYREVASFAASQGIETMIHIPMQSKGWPERRLESNGLLMSMSDTDINARLDDFMRSIPGAVGANNHMGSEFTEHEEKMRVVLGALKGRGLFYIDSVTSSETVGLKLAKEIGMKSGRRNVFLDNEQNEAYIRGQISQAVRLAKRSGRAIAICHPHPVTIQALASALPGLQKQGVTIVPASQLVR